MKLPAPPPLWRRRLRAYRRALRPVRAVFDDIYRYRMWGGRETVSGPASDAESTDALRCALPELLREFGIRTMLDAGCGDVHWSRDIDLPLDRYIGIDVVPELIAENVRRYSNNRMTFSTLNLITDRLPRVDLILCRDCLVHLSHRRARAALKNFRRSGSTWLLATTFPSARRNRRILTGGWRPVNLQLPPFNLPQPERLIREGYAPNPQRYGDKSLGLWRLNTH